MDADLGICVAGGEVLCGKGSVRTNRRALNRLGQHLDVRGKERTSCTAPDRRPTRDYPAQAFQLKIWTFADNTVRVSVIGLAKVR